MGSSASKPARKLGQQVTSQTLRQGNPSRPLPSSQGQPIQQTGRYAPAADRSTTRYSESKSQDVQNDGQDHQLLANLQKIGQVQVPRGKVIYQKSNPMLNILAARTKNSTMEDEVSHAAQRASQGVNNAGSIKNRMNAQSIIALLDERKECKTRREVEQLALAYDLDIKAFDQLARYINSPSILEGQSATSLQRKPVNVEDDSEMPNRVDAVWTEPSLSDVRQIPNRA